MNPEFYIEGTLASGEQAFNKRTKNMKHPMDWIYLSFFFLALFASTTASAEEPLKTEPYFGISKEDPLFKSYRPSYFGIRLNHSDKNYEGEVKFQLSLKYQLTDKDTLKNMKWMNRISKNWFFGYTQKSFWSIQEPSAPFRENNFSPEFFKEIDYNNWNDDNALKLLRFGLFQHESTGEAGPNSHGWNRTYLEAVFKYGDLIVSPKIWVPALFSSKEHAAPDNPDIFDYYGYGELTLYYQQSDNIIHSMTYRQGHNRDLYGFLWQTDFSLFSIGDWTPRLFVQYWSGYGESLIDYNHNTHGIVAGLSAVY